MELPIFTSKPTLRCFGLQGFPAPAPCGKPATRYRDGGAWGMHAFLCDEHAEAGDLALPPVVVFRRVRIMGHIDVAAVSWQAPRAQNEAVLRMEAAVLAAGGLLNVHGVTSHAGRYLEPDPPRTPNGVTGEGAD